MKSVFLFVVAESHVGDERSQYTPSPVLHPRVASAMVRCRFFCELRGPRSGVPDGMKVDSAAHVCYTSPAGVWLMDRPGAHLGTILNLLIDWQ